MADIMNKVQYEMDSHASESIDWINVIVAQALAGYRQDIQYGGWSNDDRDEERQGESEKRRLMIKKEKKVQECKEQQEIGWKKY